MRFFLLALLLSFTPILKAATTATPIRQAINDASRANTPQAATALLGLLMQVEAQANAQANNPNTFREWEELLYLIQKGIGKHAASSKLFKDSFSRLSPLGQALVLEGSCEHPPEKDFDAAAIKWLTGSNHFYVHVSAMDLLGMHRVKEAVPAILKFLNPKGPVCEQIAACRALARIQDPGAVRGLIDYLKNFKNGRMKYEATVALKSITGQKLDPDFAAWDGWWKQNEKDFKPVDPAEPDFNYELTGEMKEQLSYYGISVIENRIVFVFDASGSMQLGGKPDRFEKARDELKKLIEGLREDVLFNIVVFSSTVRRWDKNAPLLPATSANKKSAAAFLDVTRPGGSTQTCAALEETLREISLVNGVETVYLLTDGAPDPLYHSMANSATKTAADIPKFNEDNLSRIDYLNQLFKVRINTIGVYTRVFNDPKELVEPEVMKTFLEKLAKQNDGAYKEVP